MKINTDVLLGYFAQWPVWSAMLLGIVGTALLFLIVALAFMQIRKSTADQPYYFHFNTTLFLATLITTLLLEVSIILGIAPLKYIVFNNLQIPALLIYIIFIILLLSIIYKYFYHIRNKTSMIPVVINAAQLNKNISHYNKKGNKIKLWYLVLFIPLFIPALKFGSKSMYSIVIDNSASMIESSNHVATAIRSLVDNLDDGSVFVITTFPITDDEGAKSANATIKKNVAEIIANNELGGSLVANTYTFTKNEELLNFLGSEDFSASPILSPINEALWDNFKNSVEISSTKHFGSKHLILLSDGMDAIDVMTKLPQPCILDQKYKDKSITDFYGKNISFVNYAEVDAGIYSSCSSLVTPIQANNYTQIKGIIHQRFKNIYFEKELYYLLIAITLIGGIILTSIKL